MNGSSGPDRKRRRYLYFKQNRSVVFGGGGYIEVGYEAPFLWSLAANSTVKGACVLSAGGANGVWGNESISGS